MAELQYWVWLSERHSVRPRRRLELLERMGDVRKVYFSEEADYRAALPELTPGELKNLCDKDLEQVNRALERCEMEQIQIVTIRDAAYPERLRQTYDPPVVLFVRGHLPHLDDNASVAIVGTRKATPYGLRTAHRLGFEIAHCGAIVISGLTSGVDAEAAVGALRADGIVIGVLGGAIDTSYNGRLAQDVTVRGAVISEFGPGSGIGKNGFRMRNRITAGLSLAAVVVEAPERSGALLFAEEAESQGRELFAVPGNADAVCSAGTNALLKDGVRPATCAWDILADLAAIYPDKIRENPGTAPEPEQQPRMVKPLGPNSKLKVPANLPPLTDPPETGEDFVRVREPMRQKVIDKAPAREYIDLEQQLSTLTEPQLKLVTAMTEPGIHVDDLIEKTGLPTHTVLAELTMLQIKGFVSPEPGKRFTLNIQKK